jgi:tol-pal system-associated acyl-CoA thioesterase
VKRAPEPDLADTPAHLLSVRVYLEDTDAQGVVYHTNYLRFFERARSEILDSIGYPMRDIAEGSHRFVVYEMKIRYHRPAHLGDRLEIRTKVERSSGYRIIFRQEATFTGDSSPLVTAEVHVVSLDGRGELQELPAAMAVLSGPAAKTP